MGIQINHEIRIPFWRTRIKWKVRSCCFFFSVSHFDDVSCVASSFCSPISIFVSVYIYIYLFTYIHVTCLSIHHGQGSAVSLSFFFAERRCCGSEFRYLGPIKWYVLPPHGAVTKKHPGYLLYICTFKCMCIHLYIYIFFLYVHIFIYTYILYIRGWDSTTLFFWGVLTSHKEDHYEEKTGSHVPHHQDSSRSWSFHQPLSKVTCNHLFPLKRQFTWKVTWGPGVLGAQKK